MLASEGNKTAKCSSEAIVQGMVIAIVSGEEASDEALLHAMIEANGNVIKKRENHAL